jgi:hypothetical protein
MDTAVTPWVWLLLKFLVARGCLATVASSQHESNAASRYQLFKTLNTQKTRAVATKLRDNPSQLLSTEHNASLVGTAFPRAATMETAMNGFRNSELWPVDRFVFTDDNFSPSMVTDRLGTIKLERQTAVGTEYFSLSYVHAAKSSTPKQTPCL